MNINSFRGVSAPVRLHTKRSFQQSHYRIDKSNYFGQKNVQQNTDKPKPTKNNFKDISDKLQKITYKSLSSNQKPKDCEFNNVLKKLNFNSNKVKSTSDVSSRKPIINLVSNTEFRFKTKSGKSIPLANKYGKVCIPGEIDGLSDDDVKEAENLGHFLTGVNCDENYIINNSDFSKETIKDMLSSIGVKPGFFKLKRNSGDKEFLMLDNGSIYKESQVESDRFYYNNMDLIKNAGFTKNATCEIDGKVYKIGEKGHFDIPKGVRCVKENMKIIK